MNARLFESFCANVGFGSYSAFLMSIEHQVIFATSLIHPVIDPHSYKQFFPIPKQTLTLRGMHRGSVEIDRGIDRPTFSLIGLPPDPEPPQLFSTSAVCRL